jgi:hypothetical protein
MLFVHFPVLMAQKLVLVKHLKATLPVTQKKLRGLKVELHFYSSAQG